MLLYRRVPVARSGSYGSRSVGGSVTGWADGNFAGETRDDEYEYSVLAALRQVGFEPTDWK